MELQAANEMRERLAGMLGEEAAAQLFAGTFHSLCYRLLKRHIGELEGCGRTQAFTVFDQVGGGMVLVCWVGGASCLASGRAAEVCGRTHFDKANA